jgi:hypothetical protein
MVPETQKGGFTTIKKKEKKKKGEWGSEAVHSPPPQS